MWMTLAILAGIVLAIPVHWGIWYGRQHYPDLAAIVGSLDAVVAVFFNIMVWSNKSGSDGAYIVLQFLFYLWLLLLMLGLLQASLLRISWWRGPLGLLFEVAVAALVGVVVNMSLKRLAVILQLDQPIEPITNRFLGTFAVVLVILTTIRPFIRPASRPPAA